MSNNKINTILTNQTIELPFSSKNKADIGFKVLKSNVDIDEPDAKQFLLDNTTVVVTLKSQTSRMLRKMFLSIVESYESVLDVFDKFGEAEPEKQETDDGEESFE